MNTTVRSPRPSRWTWWRTPLAMTSAIEKLHEQCGQRIARVEVKVVAAGEHDLARTGAGESRTRRRARRPIAVDGEPRARNAGELVVGEIAIGAQIGDQR